MRDALPNPSFIGSRARTRAEDRNTPRSSATASSIYGLRRAVEEKATVPVPTATTRFLAFTDESNWNTGRFRAVAALSLPASEQAGLERELNRILGREGLRELKWTRVGSDGRATRVADAVFGAVVNAASSQHLRVDVLAWDILDSRHSIFGRDDAENLGRMYHHLLVHVCRQWPPGR